MALSVVTLGVAVVLSGAGAAAEEPAVVPVVAAVGVPFWCHFVPERFQMSACHDHARDPHAALCARLTEHERARTPVCAFSEREALDFAYLSSAALCGSAALESWDCGPSCDNVPGMESVRRIDDHSMDAHAFVGRLPDRCILSFRGADGFDSWVHTLRSLDLRSLDLVEFPLCSKEGSFCEVGAGFLESYNALSMGIKKSLREIGCGKAPLSVTGHGMGAALATLAIVDLSREHFNMTTSYTFGQPRVGNEEFASAFNRAFADLPFFRITRADDPVVHLPSRGRFHHVGTEVFYKGDTTRGHRVCDGSGEDSSCVGEVGDGEVALLILQCVVPRACGHLRYMQPARHASMSPQSCRSAARGAFLP